MLLLKLFLSLTFIGKSLGILFTTNSTDETSVQNVANVSNQHSGPIDDFIKLLSDFGEPTVVSTALANTDSKINHLSKTAHVSENLGLQVLRWNEHLSALHRKLDNMNKSQEGITESTNNVLSQMMEIKKVLIKNTNTFNCSIAENGSHIMKDIHFKIDIILNKIKKIHELENIDLQQDGPKDDETEFKIQRSFEQYRPVTEIPPTILQIEKLITQLIKSEFQDQTKLVRGNLAELIKFERNQLLSDINKTMTEQFKSQLMIIESIFESYLKTNKFFDESKTNVTERNDETEEYDTTYPTINVEVTEVPDNDETIGVHTEFTKGSCHELSFSHNSGVYRFHTSSEFNQSEREYNKRFCEIREDGLWTVLQRRDNYEQQQSFNVSWADYKYGFGNMMRDFWIGNEFIHTLSTTHNLLLRIEMEDFDGNLVYAEYSTFRILPEKYQYMLIVNDYHGNASDSFSGHNGSLFSTFDRTNDNAPACCPCAASFGSGWWFNSCFESNLNGLFFRNPSANHHFRGLIWEHWLGNYSLKRTMMMVKIKENTSSTEIDRNNGSITDIPYYEDP